MGRHEVDLVWRRTGHIPVMAGWRRSRRVEGVRSMPRQSEAVSNTMLDVVGQAIAAADGTEFQADQARYRRLALAAIRPLGKPTEAMVDAAHEAASFDAHWAINSRRDFRRAVKAMIVQAQSE